jgi:hypothetical protein
MFQRENHFINKRIQKQRRLNMKCIPAVNSVNKTNRNRYNSVLKISCNSVQSDQQETKSRVLPHLLFYRNVFLSWISRFYLLAVDTRFVGCLPLKNLSLIAFINFL